MVSLRGAYATPTFRDLSFSPQVLPRNRFFHHNQMLRLTPLTPIIPFPLYTEPDDVPKGDRQHRQDPLKILHRSPHSRYGVKTHCAILGTAALLFGLSVVIYTPIAEAAILVEL